MGESGEVELCLPHKLERHDGFSVNQIALPSAARPATFQLNVSRSPIVILKHPCNQIRNRRLTPVLHRPGRT
jgi:hypothetical protein